MAEDLVMMDVDKASARANARTISVAGSLMNEFIKDTLKK